MLKSWFDGISVRNQVSYTKPFTIEDVEGLPVTDFLRIQSNYEHLYSWYTNEALKVKSADGKSELYPLRINPIQSSVEKHVSVLVGESLESVSASGIPITIRVKLGDNVARGREISTILKSVFVNSRFTSAMVEAATQSQIFGGCVFAARWYGEKDRFYVRKIDVRTFYGIPYREDPFRLMEAWIVRNISEKEANSLGYKSYEGESSFVYWEHYTEQEYRIAVNSQTIVVDGESMQGENPWGIVPIVYIPHERESGFFGTSMITEALEGLIKELNLRNTDAGDAVSADSHSTPAIRNSRNPRIVKIGGQLPVVDLGSNTGIGGEKDPDMISVGSSSLSEPINKHLASLHAQIRRETRVPAVADGEDEGSQRSALTLSTRMYPLAAHVKKERFQWTDGLSMLCRQILKMMSVKTSMISEEEVEEASIFVGFSSLLSKDREQLVAEVVQRKTSGLGSTEHLIGLLDDVFDISEELEKIDQEQEKVANREAKKAEETAKLSSDPVSRTTKSAKAMQKQKETKEE